MTNEALMAYAEKHGHEVIMYPLFGSQSIALQDDHGKYHIAINKYALRRDKKAHLAHELGHCEYAGVYTRYSPHVLRSRCEYRADKWAFFALCPPEKIRSVIQHGHSETWEIAERLDLPENFISKMLTYYRIASLI